MTGKVVQQYALPSRVVVGVLIDNFSIPVISSASITDTDDVNTHLEARIRVVMAVTVAVGMWQVPSREINSGCD